MSTSHSLSGQHIHCRRRCLVGLECNREVAFVSMELDERADGNQIRATLGRRTGRTSVPSIFINGEGIGGCNDGSPGLLPLVESGELDTRLRVS